MHLRRTAVTVAALALTGALAGCSDDSPESPDPGIVDPAGAEPGVDEAEPGVDADAPDAPATDVEPTP